MLGISDSEVARRTGIGQRRYANYVTDEREPNFETLLKICDVLELEPNQIFGRDNLEAAHSSKPIEVQAAQLLVELAKDKSRFHLTVATKDSRLIRIECPGSSVRELLDRLSPKAQTHTPGKRKGP